MMICEITRDNRYLNIRFTGAPGEVDSLHSHRRRMLRQARMIRWLGAARTVTLALPSWFVNPFYDCRSAPPYS